MRSAAPKPKPKRARDREATRERIIAAVGAVLAAGGFRGLGINAIARRAGTDKVLIYRYFGGLDQLLAAYADEGNFWWTIDELIGPHQPMPSADGPAARLALILRRHVAALRARPITLEIMAWETIEPNELTAALSDVREKRSLAVMDHIMAPFSLGPGVDVAALVALLGAATNYLLIRERGVRHFQGLDLRRDGWDRLFDMSERIAEGLLRT